MSTLKNINAPLLHGLPATKPMAPMAPESTNAPLLHGLPPHKTPKPGLREALLRALTMGSGGGLSGKQVEPPVNPALHAAADESERSDNPHEERYDKKKK